MFKFNVSEAHSMDTLDIRSLIAGNLLLIAIAAEVWRFFDWVTTLAMRAAIY